MQQGLTKGGPIGAMREGGKWGGADKMQGRRKQVRDEGVGQTFYSQ
jgi:hypothetical protein